MFIDPYKERDEPTSSWYQDEVSKESLSFNWNVTYFKLPVLFVQLNFTDNNAISPGSFNDFLIMNFTNASYFFDISKLPVDERHDTCYFNHSIGKQMDQ